MFVLQRTFDKTQDITEHIYASADRLVIPRREQWYLTTKIRLAIMHIN